MVALRNLPAILAAQINGYPAMVYPIVYKDSGPNPTWRDDSGYPREVLVTGWNYVYITPTPTTTPEIPNGVYDVELFVARNAPVLTADANTLDIDNSLLPMIEDFVCHLALFKTSGAEFMKSVGAYENLIKTAMDYNSYLKAHSRELSIMKRKSTENKNAADARRVDETEEG